MKRGVFAAMCDWLYDDEEADVKLMVVTEEFHGIDGYRAQVEALEECAA